MQITVVPSNGSLTTSIALIITLTFSLIISRKMMGFGSISATDTKVRSMKWSG